jgi:hypothetical protein
MLRGRKLATEKRYLEAAAAFNEAVRARPYDARPRAERAYVRILGGGSPVDEIELARALTRDPALLAQISYNQGLALERRKGEHEAARRAWVRAERLGSKAASQKLGAESRCTVTQADGGPLTIRRGYRELFKELQSGSTCHPVQVRSESEAKSYACGGCPGYDQDWQTGDCKDDGPWTVQTGYMHCGVFAQTVQPLGKNRFAVLPAWTQDPPLDQQGNYWHQVSGERYSEWIYGYFEGNDGGPIYRVGEGWGDESAEEGPPCLADETHDTDLESMSGCQSSEGAVNATGETHEFYSDNGAFVGAVHLTVEDVGKVTVAIDKAGITVRGNGCDLSIPLGANTDSRR